MNKSDYIIDFERVNQLTTTIYDDPNDKSSPFSDGKFAFSVSRKYIREYLDKFISMSERNTSKDNSEHIINTLVYNGILIDKATIRDRKIENILGDEKVDMFN
jgi:hypothetical protein